MIVRLAALGLCAVLAAAMPARADELATPANDTFKAFQDFCMASGTDPVKALAAADQAGWMPVPKVMLNMMPQDIFVEPRARLRSDEDKFSILILAHGQMPGAPDVTARICAIAELPGNYDTLTAQAEALAGVPQNEMLTKPGQTAYAWQNRNGAHIPITGDGRDLRRLLDTGAVNYLVTHHDEQMSLIMLFIAAKDAI